MNEPDRTLLTLREVIEITSLSKPTIYKLINDGTFPKQLPIGLNRVAWLRREIHGWIEDHAQARGVKS